MPIGWCKKGSLTFCWRNWLWKFFPISWDQSYKNQIMEKKYVSGQLFTSVNRFEKWTSVTISTITFEWEGILRRGQKVLESRHSELEFEHKLWIFLIKIKRVISFEYGPPSYPKFGFQLCANWGCKNGSPTFCSRNWIWNIFPISWDQSSQNQILG